MAQYNVTGTCGHNTHINLIGNHKGRQSRLTWMETKPCTACWLREQGKLGAAAAKARESREEELANEIIEQAKAEAQKKAA